MLPINNNLCTFGRTHRNRLAICLTVSILTPWAAPWTTPLIMSQAQSSEPGEKSKSKTVPAYITTQHTSPRVRTVHTNKAIVRSGPADSNYPTMTLRQGAMVDVYLETSDGWSGIRPPSGSHSWIPSDVAYLLPGGKTAEIVEQETPAWIGSDFQEQADFQWQLALQKSQQVTILGEETQLEEDGTKKLWFRIAPPQGEFRWVKSSQLSDDLPSVESTANEADKPLPSVDRKSPNRSRFLQSPVSLASHQEPADNPVFETQSMPGTELVGEEIPFGNPPSAAEEPGTIVWSNEHEVLDQVQRQIQNEQVESEQGGPHQSPNSPSPAPARTKIRPIPSKGKSKKTNFNPASDSLQHWNAVKASEQQAVKQQKLRVGPVNSVLGLIGFSVVEAERAPVMAQVARNAHSQSNSHLGQVGTVGGSRLDRLPRPGQRGPAMTLPTQSISQESTFTRWMNARDPIFSQQPNPSGYPANDPNAYPGNFAGYPNDVANMPFGANGPYPMGQMTPQPLNSMPLNPPQMNPMAMNPVQTHSVAMNDRSWHGINTNRTSHTSPSSSRNTSQEFQDEDDADFDEFRTPEIQSALVELTNEIASPTESWNLNPLRNQAAAWIESGPSVLVRGEARLLMERIERFESLRQRTLGMAKDTASLAQATVQGSGVVPASSMQPQGTPNMISNGQAPSNAGDASGWLVQVHTSNPGQPEFALTDDAGNVIAYVQSTASLNLRRYLQQPVTIHGVRGYLPSLAAKQIVAERVVRIR